MINVLFRVNLGSVDAAKLGIADFRDCLAGKEVAVEDSAAKALEAAGIATLVEVVPPSAPVELKSVPAVEPPAAVKTKSKSDKPSETPDSGK